MVDSSAELLEALSARGTDAAPAIRDALLERRRAGAPGEIAWAELAERAGEHALAFTEYQRVLAADASSVGALRALAVRYEEQGDLAKALQCAEQWRQLAPEEPEAWRAAVDLCLAIEAVPRARQLVEQARDQIGSGAVAELERVLRAEAAGSSEEERASPQSATETEEDEALGPSEADAVRFCRLFSGREGVYARQWWGEGGEGGYSPVREPFTAAVARQHLLGAITVGVYPVRLDATVLFAAFDLDISRKAIATARGDVARSRELRRQVADEALRLQRELGELGVTTLLEDSGYKGRHLWLLFDEPQPAEVVRRFGLLFARAHPLAARELQLELFPKQADPGGGLGNLIKLPLGLHRRTGRRCSLLDPAGAPVADPHRLLREHARSSAAMLLGALDRVAERVAATTQVEGFTAPGRERGAPAPLDGAAREAEPAPRTWAEVAAMPEIARLLEGCCVLRQLAHRAESERRLRYSERVVLRHALGHSPAGVSAFNYLVGRCASSDPSEPLRGPLSGHPVSCARIRKRIPEVTSRLPCNCAFDFAPDHYPTPRLHLLARSGPGAALDAVPEPARPALEPKLAALLEANGGRVEIGAYRLVVIHAEGEPPRLEILGARAPGSEAQP